MIAGTHFYKTLIFLLVSGFTCTVYADGELGNAFIYARIARGVKKAREKKEASKTHKEIMAKLKERYPKEVEKIQAEAKEMPETAKIDTEALIQRYKKETGVDLNNLVKSNSREGIIRSRLRAHFGRFREDQDNTE
ncbi:MAG: hypothetical protein JXR78_01180 [Victivallales bacterium]|nr:hypothetical protein [Victivallales bacterium]